MEFAYAQVVDIILRRYPYVQVEPQDLKLYAATRDEIWKARHVAYSIMIMLGVGYAAERFDCDNFSSFYTSLVEAYVKKNCSWRIYGFLFYVDKKSGSATLLGRHAWAIDFVEGDVEAVEPQLLELMVMQQENPLRYDEKLQADVLELEDAYIVYVPEKIILS